jgi:anti-anti-sigma factor
VVIGVRGDLHPHLVPRLRSEVDFAIYCTALDVCIDFSESHYFESATVGLLVVTARRLRATGRKLSLRGLTSTQFAILRLCGLPKIATLE